MQKLVVGLCGSLGAMIISLPTWGGTASRTPGATFFATLVPLFIINTRKWYAHDRTERVGLGPIFSAAIVGFVVNLFAHGSLNLVIAALAGTAMLVQILSPWDPVAGAQAKEREEAGEEEDEDDEEKRRRRELLAGAASPAANFKAGMADVAARIRQGAPGYAPSASDAALSRYWYKPVWRFARMVWLGLVVILLTCGVMFCVAGGVDENLQDQGPMIAAGVSMIVASLFCFLKSFQRRFYGWWGYLFKPALLLLCVCSIVISAIVMGNLPERIQTDEAIVGTFFIVFPVVLGLVLLFVPGKWLNPAHESLAGTGSMPSEPIPPMPMNRPLPESQAAFARARSPISASAGFPIWDRNWGAWMAARAHRPRHTFESFFSGIAGLLILVSILIAVALALDIPGMIAAGVPDMKLATELQTKVFPGIEDWPRLLTKVASAVSVVLMMVGIVVMLFARRGGGVTHMFRGVIGAAGLLLAMGPLSERIRHQDTWNQVAALLAQKQVGGATDFFVNQMQSGSAIASAAIFFTFLILLAWPPRRHRAAELPQPPSSSGSSVPPSSPSSAVPAADKGA